MRIHAGCTIIFDLPNPAAVITLPNVVAERRPDLR